MVLLLLQKVNLSKNAVLTSGMVAEVDERTEDSTRTQEYNMIALPTDIETGDTIDIRLRMPDGTDYIVISKKINLSTRPIRYTIIKYFSVKAYRSRNTYDEQCNSRKLSSSRKQTLYFKIC